MALERFIDQHLRIADTLVGVPCERMTALEIHFACMPYDVAEATLIADRANDINGTYTVLHALLFILKLNHFGHSTQQHSLRRH